MPLYSYMAAGTVKDNSLTIPLQINKLIKFSTYYKKIFLLNMSSWFWEINCLPKHLQNHASLGNNTVCNNFLIFLLILTSINEDF